MNRVGILVMLLLGALVACRSVGRQLVEGVHARKDTLAEAIRPAAHALVAEAGRTFDDSVRSRLVKATGEVGDRLEVSVNRAVSNLDRRVRLMEDSLGWFIANPGRDALHNLLTPNLDALRASLRGSIRLWISDLSRSIDSLLPDVTARLVDRAATRVSLSLANNVDSTGALGKAVVRLGDQVVRQAIKAIRQETSRKTPWWVWAAVAVAAALVISIVGTFILKLSSAKHQREASLRAMAQAIRERNDPVLAKRVKALAVEHGVEPSLHHFLEEQRLLIPEPGASP